MGGLPRDSIFQRHPRWSAALLLTFTVLIVLGIAELVARWLAAYEPGYYTATSGRRGVQGEVAYPYGVVKINSLGFPDDEFDLEDDRPRIGYFGDSVTFGVGAGYGYRITEVLEEYYPDMQHMNLSGGLGTGVTARVIEEVLDFATRFHLTTVVYLLNMNDISPGKAEPTAKAEQQTTLIKALEAKLDFFRGRSYLYTWARNAVKTFLISHGFGVQGVSYELYPERYEDVIAQTAHRVNYLREALERLGVELVVVVLPYEMQISQEAEHIFLEKGVSWGDGFIEGLTQQKLIERLQGMRVFNAVEAFANSQGDASARKSNKAGQYFVHDRGGRLDWNHPVRAGHRRIAEYLARNNIFGRPTGFGRTEVTEPAVGAANP